MFNPLMLAHAYIPPGGSASQQSSQTVIQTINEMNASQNGPGIIVTFMYIIFLVYVLYVMFWWIEKTGMIGNCPIFYYACLKKRRAKDVSTMRIIGTFVLLSLVLVLYLSNELVPLVTTLMDASLKVLGEVQNIFWTVVSPFL